MKFSVLVDVEVFRLGLPTALKRADIAKSCKISLTVLGLEFQASGWPWKFRCP